MASPAVILPLQLVGSTQYVAACVDAMARELMRKTKEGNKEGYILGQQMIENKMSRKWSIADESLQNDEMRTI